MKIAKLISLLGVLAVTVVLFYGFTFGDFSGEGSQPLSVPWGIVSLADLYTGFTLLSMWIIYREKSLPVAMLRTSAMITFGFFAGALYAFLALQAGNHDRRKFWLGKYA